MSQPPSQPITSSVTQAPTDIEEQFVREIADLLDAGERGEVLQRIADLHPADLAELLSHMPLEEARQLFVWLPADRASDALAELDGTIRAALLEDVSAERLRSVIDALDTDDAADLLNDLPEEQAHEVLPILEDTEDLATLIVYPEESAGGLMAREYVAVPETWTLGEVTEEVRLHAEQVDEVYAVFVLDEEERLKGVVSLKDIVLAPAGTAVQDVMRTDFICVTTEVDQEEVARIMQRYDLVSLPVVDKAGRLLGRITIDDIVDVMREEAEEDIQLISGVSGDEQPNDPVLRISRGRMPWLIVGLIGAGLSGTVIGTFEATLEQAVVLATFIPIVTAMGGNAAVQSAAITVQGLSSGKLWPGDVVKRTGKEVLVALVNGLVLAGLVCLTVFALQLGNVAQLVLTLGLTMFTVILLATTNGALVPFVLNWFNIDPASAMGPFVTTLNDIIGLTVYFIYATTLYL